MENMFSQKDLNQLNKAGIRLEEVEKQLEWFREGFPFLNILKPARVKDGILQLSPSEIDHFVNVYEESLGDRVVLKFVPASGAASRMFKSLFEFLNTLNDSPEDVLNLLVDRGFDSVYYAMAHLRRFAFMDDLQKVLTKKGYDLDRLMEQSDFEPIIRAILLEDGLNYGNLPKGLLKFHKYSDSSRTPTEEHIVEGASYCLGGDGVVRIHFTVSPEHLNAFSKHIEQIKPRCEKMFGVKLDIGFSVQKKSTDTLAVDMENRPFRNPDGSLLFRPAGHGALLENLQDLDADIIFIKNIDNVVPDRLKPVTVRFKKALAGILIDYQTQIFNFIQDLDKPNVQEERFDEIEEFVIAKLFVQPSAEYSTFDRASKVAFLRSKLDRPLRVCGMVRNEGEPGGGPFWALNADGTMSLQIVESSQIDLKSAEKKAIVQKATHFNPVDLVISAKNSKGGTFDLLAFRDDKTGFISKKSKDGKDLKAMEIPGLWNGAMSDWNTIFLEVPIETFNPVKIINDLLREEHTNLENLAN